MRGKSAECELRHVDAPSARLALQPGD